MRKLVVLMILLLTLCGSAQERVKLLDLVDARGKNFLKNSFPSVPMDSIFVELSGYDGPGGISAWVMMDVETESTTIFVDVEDWYAFLPLREGIFKFEGVRKSFFHELVHIEQSFTGKARRELLFEHHEFYQYGDRPHEREAYARQEFINSKWCGVSKN